MAMLQLLINLGLLGVLLFKMVKIVSAPLGAVFVKVIALDKLLSKTVAIVSKMSGKT
jgi:hypothetical protein